jgi:hypothetical protein
VPHTKRAYQRYNHARRPVPSNGLRALNYSSFIPLICTCILQLRETMCCMRLERFSVTVTVEIGSRLQHNAYRTRRQHNAHMTYVDQ